MQHQHRLEMRIAVPVIGPVKIALPAQDVLRDRLRKNPKTDPGNEDSPPPTFPSPKSPHTAAG